ncbi:MAG TPA: hypothetical protein VIA82_06695 [Candidatus Limnocylindria bacterium]
MTIAALLAFGTLLAAWLTAPAERWHRAETATQSMPELAAEPQAA